MVVYNCFVLFVSRLIISRQLSADKVYLILISFQESEASKQIKNCNYFSTDQWLDCTDGFSKDKYWIKKCVVFLIAVYALDVFLFLKDNCLSFCECVYVCDYVLLKTITEK